MTERVKDIYKYWLNQNLEDIELTKELEQSARTQRPSKNVFTKIWNLGPEA